MNAKKFIALLRTKLRKQNQIGIKLLNKCLLRVQQ